MQSNPIEVGGASLESLTSLRHLRDLHIEVQKLTSRNMKQVTRIKRINGISAQEVFKKVFQEENNCESKAVVGGGAGSGLGPGHHATTLTSFNVSAIANPLSIESPEDGDQRAHNYH